MTLNLAIPLISPETAWVYVLVSFCLISYGSSLIMSYWSWREAQECKKLLREKIR